MSDSGDTDDKIPPPPNASSLSHQLTSKTELLNLKLYVVIAILLAAVLAAFLLVFLCLRARRASRRRSSRMRVKHSSGSIPLVSKEIAEIKDQPTTRLDPPPSAADGKTGKEKMKEAQPSESPAFDVEKGRRSGEGDVFGWGRWYSLEELEAATRGFSPENVIGEGGYGVVYRGALQDGSVVAVKNLHNNKGQAQTEFKVEVEAIGKVKHKNLVGLIGYCAEGAQRMLVYEYIDNGNLEQWLHGDVGPVSPLTWDIRMKIAIGTAKGVGYLHEGLEPKVVHRDIKSSNILLDRK